MTKPLSYSREQFQAWGRAGGSSAANRDAQHRRRCANGGRKAQANKRLAKLRAAQVLDANGQPAKLIK